MMMIATKFSFLISVVCLVILSSHPHSVVSALAVPKSPTEQTQRAIASLKNAIAHANENNQKKRFYVDYLIPLPPETQAEDIDPWPGGLAQMYPYAEDIVKELLKGICEEPTDNCNSQIVSASDCCGFFVQESQAGAKQDVAAVVFPGVDQLEQLQQIDAMVGDERCLLLFNKQFQRPVDFGFAGQQKSRDLIFDQYQWGFAFQEMACRGEDVKLMFEHPTWSAIAYCDEDLEAGVKEVPLLKPSTTRFGYDALEKEINRVLPEPLWMRKMGEVERKGFKFQRGGNP